MGCDVYHFYSVINKVSGKGNQEHLTQEFHLETVDHEGSVEGFQFILLEESMEGHTLLHNIAHDIPFIVYCKYDVKQNITLVRGH